MGNSTQLCQSSPENGPLPDASSINCDGFLVSTYLFQIVPRNMAPDNPAALPGEQQSQRRLLFGHRQPFVRNGVSPYTECIALTSKLQRIAVVRNPSSSEVISFSYSSAFVCYSAGRSRIRRKKTKCGKRQGRFLHVGAFTRERTGIIVFCIVRTFASTVLLVQFSLCRTLATVVHCIMVYIQTTTTIPT